MPSSTALAKLLDCARDCCHLQETSYQLLSVHYIAMHQGSFLSMVFTWNSLGEENSSEGTRGSHFFRSAVRFSIDGPSPSASGGDKSCPQFVPRNELLKALVFEAAVQGLRMTFTVESYPIEATEEPSQSETRLERPACSWPEYDVVLVREPEISVPLLEKALSQMGDFGFRVHEAYQLSDARKMHMRAINLRASRWPTKEELNNLDEFHAKEKSMVKALKAVLLAECKEYSADVAIQKRDVLRFCRRLVAFDMDSTLIQEEVIDELGREAGLEKIMKNLTARSLAGDLDFAESLTQRVRLLKGKLSLTQLKAVEKRLHFTPGARRLCGLLRLLGYRLAVVSGGFTMFARFVKRELHLHHAFANNLLIDSETGLLTGELSGPVVSPQRKAAILQMLADLEGCSLEQVIAVGDGANDIGMLVKAGMGVAFCAKPKVQETAEFRINHRNLSNLLFLLGISESDALKIEMDYRATLGRRLGHNGSATSGQQSQMFPSFRPTRPLGGPQEELLGMSSPVSSNTTPQTVSDESVRCASRQLESHRSLLHEVGALLGSSMPMSSDSGELEESLGTSFGVGFDERPTDYNRRGATLLVSTRPHGAVTSRQDSSDPSHNETKWSSSADPTPDSVEFYDLPSAVPGNIVGFTPELLRSLMNASY